MGLRRVFLDAKLSSLAWGVFFLGLVAVSIWFSKQLPISEHKYFQVQTAQKREAAPEELRPRVRARRQVDLLADLYPVSLQTLFGCSVPYVLPDFSNATCIVACNSDSTSCDTTSISSVSDGSATLACTANIMMLGFRRTAGIEISKWLGQSSLVNYKYGGVTNAASNINYYDCPEIQLSSSESDFYYMSPYSVDAVNEEQNTYVLYCDECMDAPYAEISFGSLYLDLQTLLLPYIYSSNQKFLITMKNPTDRLIADYFYPYIRDGTDLDTVGGSVLHDLMVLALEDVQTCISSIGVTPCVYGVEPSGVTAQTSSDVRSLIYESCYSIKLAQVIQQVPIDQIMFVQSEEYAADPEAVMADVFSFIGVDYAGTLPTYSSSVHKPILSETVALLDDFFTPFNLALSDTLGDTKWLYTRT